MNWWDELWLNESFATWVGWWAIDHLHPEWKVWDQFLVGRKSKGIASLWLILNPFRLRQLLQLLGSIR